VLAGRLDRELEPQYRLRLVAYDGGEPARSASVDVVVTVADSNDNRPRFTSDEYQATVAENAPVGTVVVQVYQFKPNSITLASSELAPNIFEAGSCQIPLH